MAPAKRPVPVTQPDHRASRTVRRIAFVALAAIGLGFWMQGMIVAARVLAGSPVPAAGFVAELAGMISWSVLVCTGIALGTSLGKARAVLAGLVGLVFAPLGLAAAKGAQKFVGALVEASTAPSILSLEVIGIVRALEYGVLAFVLVLLAERRIARLTPYLVAGLAVGGVFGGFLSGLTILIESLNGTGRSLPIIATSLVTEIGFPIGCALLIYLGQLITQTFGQIEGSRPSAA